MKNMFETGSINPTECAADMVLFTLRAAVMGASQSSDKNEGAELARNLLESAINVIELQKEELRRSRVERSDPTRQSIVLVEKFKNHLDKYIDNATDNTYSFFGEGVFLTKNELDLIYKRFMEEIV